MYLTRYQIRKHKNKVLHLLSNKHFQKRLKKIAIKICRTQNIIIIPKIKMEIEFINFENGHWAETDGKTTWLNNSKKFDSNLLYFTLLHEYLHGVIRRHPNFEIPEEKEHKIMEIIDKKLI